MAQFELPEAPDLPAAPPPDPMAAREEKIANDTRVESEINRFLAARQDALFHAPDAFYRTEGEDAIHAAPETGRKLDALRRDLIDRAANDYQRGRLGAALGAQMELTRDGMARHVAEQSLAWQRQVAQDRIALLTKEAALHHSDDTLIDTLGHAAATAARAHARVGGPSTSLRAGGPPAGETEDAAAATARSGVFGAAIQARLDRGDADGAKVLLTRVQNQLDPGHIGTFAVRLDQGDGKDVPDDARLAQVSSGGTPEPTPILTADSNFVGAEPAPSSQVYQSAMSKVETTPANGGSGAAPPTEPPSNSIELEREFERMQGEIVRLPNGAAVPSKYGSSGYLMSPFSDLSDVAAAGRKVRASASQLMGINEVAAPFYLREVVRDAVGHGGIFDYQRRHYAFGKDGYTQLRQFQDVSNFNVGLYCQQAGVPLDVTLKRAGKYAVENSLNAAPNAPDKLDPRTREFIVLGYRTGESGVFDPSKR